jgi:predicted glutamine amidotransferase
MSRILAAVSGRPIAAGLLQAFRALGDNGRTPKDFGCPQPDPKPGHPDGWGIACLGEGEEVYRRGAVNAAKDPAFEETVRAVGRMTNPPFLLLAHVRRSPRRDEIRPDFSHPFRREVPGRVVFFAHDGTCEGYGVRGGRTDSIALFDRLLEGLGLVQRDEAGFKQAAAQVKAAFDAEFPRKVTSYTFAMIDGDRLVAHRDARSCVPYFALHEAKREGVSILCSEVLPGFEGKWRLLRNGELLVIPARS